MNKAVYGMLLMATIVGSAKGDAGCKNIEFLDCIKGKALAGHMIKSIYMKKPGVKRRCKHQCYKEKRCLSYNLAHVDGETRSCEINNADHVDNPKDVKFVPGSEYCGLKNPCSSIPCESSKICRPDFYTDGVKCISNKSCADLKMWFDKSGVYNITPVPGYTIQVYCDQVTDGGGWTVIQKRLDGSVNFYRGWDDYKRGFGDKNGEYWLGLDAIHILTKIHKNKIRIDLRDSMDDAAYALYESFSIGTEKEYYALNLGKFVEGEAGDSLSYHNLFNFSTYDFDHDASALSNCAKIYKGAWWYRHCYRSHLNGRYYLGQEISSPYYQIRWFSWNFYRYAITRSEMKMRPVDFKPLK